MVINKCLYASLALKCMSRSVLIHPGLEEGQNDSKQKLEDLAEKVQLSLRRTLMVC